MYMYRDMYMYVRVDIILQCGLGCIGPSLYSFQACSTHPFSLMWELEHMHQKESLMYNHIHVHVFAQWRTLHVIYMYVYMMS